jgi:hypothetical protein
MVSGLGIRPQQLVPEALESMAKAAGAGSATIDPASIDAGVLARTVLVARLLSGQPTPLAVLQKGSVEKFKQDFNSGAQLSENAKVQAGRILRQSILSSTLDGPGREVAARWIASLSPLGPVLGHPRP